MSKLRLVCFLFFSQSLFSLADTEFEGPIPVDVVEALFNSYGENQFAVYSDVPDEFPDLQIPAEFSVVGSVYQMTSLRVVFATQLNEEDAVQAMVDVFEAENWMQLPIMESRLPRTGFIAPNQINVGNFQALCHDDFGRVTIRFSERAPSNYLSAALSAGRNRPGYCQQQLTMQQAAAGQMSRSIGLRQYLPRMEIPADQNRQRLGVAMVGGLSSSSNSVDTEASMTSEQSLDEVYRYFADQIEEQGWELDSEAVGSLSANGTWAKSPEANLNLLGRLSVTKSGESDYDLQFTLTAEGYMGDGSAIYRAIGQ